MTCANFNKLLLRKNFHGAFLIKKWRIGHATTAKLKIYNINMNN